MDVTNPGLVSVADQSYGNPQLTVSSEAVPVNEAVLTPVADESEPRVTNDVGSSAFPTPEEDNVLNQQYPALPQAFGSVVPTMPNYIIANQSIGQGSWVPVNPADPLGEKKFQSPAEFVVVSEGDNVQTNTNDESEIFLKVAGVGPGGVAILDPDTMLPPATPDPAISGSFSSATSGGVSATILYSPSAFPAGFADGTSIQITNSTVGAYNGLFAVSGITQLSLAYASISNAGGGKITVHASAPLPVSVVNGALVTLASDTVAAYNGSYIVSNVTATTFDVTATFTVTDTGTFYLRSFQIPLAFVSTATGIWSTLAIATRYLLFVTLEDDQPANLNQIPVSLQGREIVFADDTITADDQGASRFISWYGYNYIIIDRADQTDQDLPSLTIPQLGDVFSLDVSRQGAQDISRESAPPVDVIVGPTFIPFSANPDQALLSQGNINVTTNPQPGEPIITSGQVVPTATTVNIADQPTVIGLPTNVFT